MKTTTTTQNRRAKRGRLTADRATWQTNARELRWVLKAVLPHAGKTPDLPVLGLVRFEVDGEQLHAVATNRYTLAVVRQQVDPAHPQARFAIGVPAKTLEAVLRLLSVRDTVTVTFTADGVSIDNGTFNVHLPAFSGAGAYPNWRPMLGRHLRLPVRSSEPTGLNPQLFALFQSARCGHAAPVVIQHRDSEPGTPGTTRSVASVGVVTVTCGDWFVGAVMPMRLSEHDGELGAWLELCPDPEADSTTGNGTTAVNAA